MEYITLAVALAAAQTELLRIQIASASIEPPAIVQTIQTTEARVREYFADIPVMVEVARCESRFRHYDENGQTLKGEIDPQDRGTFQINERYHLAESKKQGFDILSLEGNLGYARRLYELNGTRDWLASASCWSGTPLGGYAGLLGKR